MVPCRRVRKRRAGTTRSLAREGGAKLGPGWLEALLDGAADGCTIDRTCARRAGWPSAPCRDVAARCRSERRRGVLRGSGQGGWAGRLPVPRQELLELMLLGAARDDALEHVGEVGERVEAVELGGLDQGEGDGPVLGGAGGSGEQRIFSSQSNRPHAALHG